VSVLASGTVLQVLFDLPFWAAILLAGGVVVVYSSIGGMWSLTLTDIVQFAIKTVGLMFVLLPICLYRVGGWDALAAKLPSTAFSLTTIGYDTILTYFLIYFFGILIGQDIWQRVFTARSERVARVAGSLAGVYCVIYGLVGALIGMCAKVLLPDLANANNAFASIVQSALPDGIRGLVIAAALAAMMSTASAGLLAAATTVTEDLLPKLRNRMMAAFEASGLTREAYTQLVLSRDEAANAILEEAFAEWSARNAKDEALLRAFEASGQTLDAFADMYGMVPRTVGQQLERARRRAAAAAAAVSAAPAVEPGDSAAAA